MHSLSFFIHYTLYITPSAFDFGNKTYIIDIHWKLVSAKKEKVKTMYKIVNEKHMEASITVRFPFLSYVIFWIL